MTHLAETLDEAELLQHGTGPLRSMLEHDIGVWDASTSIAGMHPVEYAIGPLGQCSGVATHLNWIDVSQVDSSVDSNHTTSLWSHAVQATRSNWDSINKTSVVDNLSSDIHSYEIIHPANTSRVQFYTVMHSFNGLQDERFLSSNSLTLGITEDNVGSSITGTLLVNFDAANSTTELNWNGSIIEED